MEDKLSHCELCAHHVKGTRMAYVCHNFYLRILKNFSTTHELNLATLDFYLDVYIRTSRHENEQ